MNNVYLFQPQYPVRLKKTVNYWIPYSAGCLWSYASQDQVITSNFTLSGLFFKRDPVDIVLKKIKNPCIVGFSCYLWNENYCLTLAQSIKKEWPNCKIIFGGPQVNSDLLKHDFVDSVVMGEGEEPFRKILHSIVEKKEIEQFYPKSRLEDLDIPSPYIAGVFDNLIKENLNTKWATTIETNRGCPYACTFCDWGGVTYSKVKKFSLDRVEKELNWISQNKVEYLFVADANFGIFKDRDLEIVKLIKKHANSENSIIEAVNLQYSKNNIEWIFEIGKELGHLNRGITVSVQSMNPSTLKEIKRINLESNNINHVLSLGEKYRIPTYTELILGLPFETPETWKEGICKILELGQHQSIMISFLELLKNSELNSFSSRLKYGIKSISAEQVDIDDTINESIEIVNQTSTMSTDDIVESYFYGWLLLHCHISGYTQLFSRYGYEVENISYREFYDRVFEQLLSNSVFRDFCLEFKESVRTYLTTGKFVFKEEKTNTFQSLYFLGHEFFYKNKKVIFEIGYNVLLNYNVKNLSDINELQQFFVWDKEFQFPMIVNSNIDISSWKIKKTTYKISSYIEDLGNEDLYATRYKNLIKNYFDVINFD